MYKNLFSGADTTGPNTFHPVYIPIKTIIKKSMDKIRFIISLFLVGKINKKPRVLLRGNIFLQKL